MDLDLGDTRLLIKECKKRGALRNQAAYILGSVYHETGYTMKPVREAFGKTDAQTIARLDKAWAAGKLRWVRTPYWRDGWFGRGYIQLTHDYNYQRVENETGHKVHRDPAKALDPKVSAVITVRGMLEGWFTGKKLGDYVTLRASNYYNARRVVNGLDRAQDIANYAVAYEAKLLEEGYGVDAPRRSFWEWLKSLFG